MTKKEARKYLQDTFQLTHKVFIQHAEKYVWLTVVTKMLQK